MISPSRNRSDHRCACGWFLTTLLLALLAAPQANARADDNAIANGEEPASLEVFQLKHVSAEIAADVLQTLMAGEPGLRLARDETNRVIVYGTASQLDTIRKTLAELDQAPDGAKMLKIFSLQESDASMVADVIRQIVNDVTIAIDSRTNSVVASSPSEEHLDVIEMLAAELDRSESAAFSATYKLELFWVIEADDDADDAGKNAPFDPRIAEAVIELQRQGFTKIRQVGHVRVGVKSGGRFGVRSNETLGHLAVEGEIEQTSDRQLELKLDLAILQQGDETASLLTEINTQPDQNVVIGIVSATHSGRRSAFVVRVEK